MTRPAAVIVLAAGQGTRMKSSRSKVVHPVAGLSMIGHALRAARGIDPEYLVTVVRHQRDMVVEEVLRVDPTVLIADQDEIPGTGSAVRCGLDALAARMGAIAGTIVVTSGDVPMLTSETLSALVNLHENQGHAATVLTTIAPDPTGYGRIVRNEGGAVARIVEQRDATAEEAAIDEINAGIYAFDGAFLVQALKGIGSDNAQGEVYLTDVVAAAAPAGRTAGAMVLTDQWQAEGCNDRVQLAALGAEFNRRICEGHMRAGVSIPEPASTWIDVDVTIGQDTTVHPGTCLRGSTTIGAGCEIGPAAILENCEVGDGAHVPTVWGLGALVAADTMVAPFSVLGSSARE